jgi:thiol-disulfide isomerase/thioredoxin
MMALRVGKDVFDYINDVKIDRSKHAMKKRLQEYTPNPHSIDRLENIDQKFHLIVFSAEWCGDCVAYVPALAKSLAIAKNAMIQARVVDSDNYRDMADEMNVRKLPTIIVFDKNWREIGRFIESPRKYGTVEEELCAILDSTTGSAKA